MVITVSGIIESQARAGLGAGNRPASMNLGMNSPSGAALPKNPAGSRRGAESRRDALSGASFSETVITILTDAAAIDTAYHARDGLLSGTVAGKLFIEMSTVRPGTSASFRRGSGKKARP